MLKETTSEAAISAVFSAFGAVREVPPILSCPDTHIMSIPADQSALSCRPFLWFPFLRALFAA
eukprot:scaffold239060_cov26-Tisochrysis_lutea.AAC.3